MKLIKVGSQVPEAIIEEIKRYDSSEEGIYPVIEIVSIKEEDIEEKALEFLAASKPLFLCSKHASSLPILRAFNNVYPKNPGVIFFDAHIDAEFDKDILNDLVSIFNGENLVLVGCRRFGQKELQFAKEHNIRLFSMKEITSEGLREVSDSFMSIAKNFSDLYISIDIDVLDPAYAPGTGCPEPGGLSARELLFFLHRLKRLRNLRAMDIAEVNPEHDINNLTVKAAAKIIVELC